MVGDRDAPLKWLENVRPAEWIATRLHPFALDTGSVVPDGFEAYCRIFHPVEPSRLGEPRRRWAEVAAGTGRIVHPEMQFHMISRPVGSPTPGRYERDHGPR